jgi:rRNA maturation protein Nop10
VEPDDPAPLLSGAIRPSTLGKWRETVATYSLWKCDSCGYAVETNGPHEFYLDTQGEHQRYGHPVPRSEEAGKAGVAGLTTLAYCPVCDEVHEVVIQEFDPPRNFITCWLGAHHLIEPTCPECGSI